MLRRWFTDGKIEGLQLAVLIACGVAVAVFLAWLTTRGTSLGWFSS